MRSHPNPYEVGQIVLWTLYDVQLVCEVIYKGPNYLELLDIRNPAPEVFPHRVYEKSIDTCVRSI